MIWIVCKKLSKAFKLGLSDEDACYFADISLHEFRLYEKAKPQLGKKKLELKKGYQLIKRDREEWINKILEGNCNIGDYEFEYYSGDRLLNRYSKKIEDFYLEKTKREEQNTFNELENLEKEIVATMSLDTKELMLKAIPVGNGNKGFALELAKSLERDFEVKTAVEKSLVQMAVLAFIIYLHTNYEVQQNSYVRSYSDEQKTSTGYLIAVSKEKNNALRQYTSIIQTLKNLKASPIKFNIITKNLNLGQNQQINNPVEA